MTSLTARGVKAAYITEEQDDPSILQGVVQGNYQLVYFTPEMVLCSKKWRKVLLTDVYMLSVYEYLP